MDIIQLEPYKVFEDQSYEDVKIVIKDSYFKGITPQKGKITFVFLNCLFQNLEIENNESINFENVSIAFFNCYIKNITIETFVATNCSVIFNSSILSGRIKNENLLSIDLNDCISNNSIFLVDLNKVSISFTEENIFSDRWRILLYSIGANLETLLEIEQRYSIHNCRNISHNFNERRPKEDEPHRQSNHEEKEYKIEDQDNWFRIYLNIFYSLDKEHKQTKIINAKLSALTIKGYSTGELSIENSKIDNLYIHDFSVSVGASFYNIRPLRDTKENKLEIKNSNLDKVWFDNFAFNDYSEFSLYRNKFNETYFTACNFPEDYEGFEKMKTIANIHYPDEKDNNYFKIRYETFLQLKKRLESSGNVYEALKFQSISHEALRNIENLSFWDKLILNINRWSNNHGLSLKRPLCGILFFSCILYILYLLSIGRIFNSNDIDWNLFGYYFSFLDITHRSDFLVNKSELNGFAVAIDYINKIVVGFYIYQFVAVFRKYGKR